MNSNVILLAIFILSLACIYGLLMKRKGRIVPKDIFYLGHVFILTLLLFWAYTAIYLAVTFRERHFPFDKEVWRSNREERVCMVDDLIRRKVLNSLNEDNTVALLGDPMEKRKDSVSVRYAYYLGFRNNALAIDPEFLMLKFKKGQLDNYYLSKGVPH